MITLIIIEPCKNSTRMFSLSIPSINVYSFLISCVIFCFNSALLAKLFKSLKFMSLNTYETFISVITDSVSGSGSGSGSGSVITGGSPTLGKAVRSFS